MLHIVEAITIGFFAPIFFASIGLNLRLEAVTAIPGLLLALLAVAFVSKIVGGGVSAAACCLSLRSALAVGIGINARCAVELIVAGIALEARLLGYPDPPPAIIPSFVFRSSYHGYRNDRRVTHGAAEGAPPMRCAVLIENVA